MKFLEVLALKNHVGIEEENRFGCLLLCCQRKSLSRVLTFCSDFANFLTTKPHQSFTRANLRRGRESNPRFWCCSKSYRVAVLGASSSNEAKTLSFVEDLLRRTWSLSRDLQRSNEKSEDLLSVCYQFQRFYYPNRCKLLEIKPMEARGVEPLS